MLWALFGPLLGVTVLMALLILGVCVVLAWEGFQPASVSRRLDTLMVLIAVLPLTVIAAYVMGVVPAVLAATGMIFVQRHEKRRAALLFWAVLVGALATMPLAVFKGGLPPDLAIGGLYVATGSVTTFLLIARRTSPAQQAIAASRQS